MSLPICDIPEDLQLRILSFLSPPEISNFSCTSKQYASLCSEDGKIWHAICDRRWGKKTQIQKWRNNGLITYRNIYKTLSELENLIGFWRLSGRANSADSSPPLVFFEWGPCHVIGSKVTAVNDDTYQVKKTPFLLMSISTEGRSANFLDLNGNYKCGDSIGDLIPVDVKMSSGHIIVEESPVFKGGGNSSSGDDESEDFVVEVYTQLANKTSPRRQKKKEKERQGRVKWEPEHFIKIVDCSPTITKPLQGLWKGFCEGRNMEFYSVKYREVGGIIICRKVVDSALSPNTTAVFWTRNYSFVASPFSAEEEMILNSGIRTGPLREEVDVSGMMYLNSMLPGEAGEEGRVWLYETGSFGFGFLQDRLIVDLKRVAQDDGYLADVLEV